VHTNSGIPNHAFLCYRGGNGRLCLGKAGMVWYLTLRDKLTDRATFQDCAKLTYQVAGRKFGKGSLEQKAVQKVGLKSVSKLEQRPARKQHPKNNSQNEKGGVELSRPHLLVLLTITCSS